MLEFLSGEEPVRVRYFPARFLRDVPSTEGRELRRCGLDEALALILFEDARGIVRTARRLIEGILDTGQRERHSARP